MYAKTQTLCLRDLETGVYFLRTEQGAVKLLKL